MIEIKSVSKIYTHNNQSQVILDNLSHVFERGSKTAILGESGSGKTTLLNLIGGIDLEFTGQLLYRGQEIVDFDKFRRENVSFIFQDLNLINHLSIIKNITISLTNDVSNKEEKAIELLKRVGLYDHRDKKPNQLSGGERQRVAIARALARETDILLCDEPTGSLDDETKIEIMDFIMDVFKDKTVIFVTHDEALAKEYSQEVIIFDEHGINHKILKTAQVKPILEEKKIKNKTFKNRFELNLLSRKFSLFNASYLVIIISALFLFGTGIIKGIETEVDDHYIDEYKVDKIDVRTSRFTIGGFSDFVSVYNQANKSQIKGFMTGLSINTAFSQGETYEMYLYNLQDSIKSSFESDLIIGHFPNKNNEVLYSKGSAILSLYNFYTETIDDEQKLAKHYNNLLDITNEELLQEVNALDISYKNTYKYNEEWQYDRDLEIVGIIDDHKYFSNDSVNFTFEGKEKSLMVNAYIYMLEEEFLDYIYNVYMGYNDKKFMWFSVFVEEENFDLRNEVFDGFLLHGFQISGRDYITNERNNYHDTLHGYKITLIVACSILLIFGAISIYNGLQTNIERSKKNIGIYKSLGYTSKNIKTMFIKEGLLISLFALSFSFIIWFIIKKIMNSYVVKAIDPTDIFGFQDVAYLAPISVSIVVILILSIIMTSINQEFKKINIVSLIKHK